MGFGEAIEELRSRLTFGSDSEEEWRLAQQLYLAYYLLEYGYTEPVDFFARFTTLQESIVLPDQYKFIKPGGMQIVDIKCHNVVLYKVIEEINCHRDYIPITIEELVCHDVVVEKIITEILCHG